MKTEDFKNIDERASVNLELMTQHSKIMAQKQLQKTILQVRLNAL